MLRVDTDGQGVPGNAPAPFDPRIYTYGHRNVQGIAFSPGGKAYSIEHGTDRDDEVNRLYAGANYGWDPGRPRRLGLRRVPADDRPDPAPGRHAGRSGRRASPPSPRRAARSSRAPQWKGWHGALAMAVLKGKQLRVLAFDTTGTRSTQQWVRITDQGRLRVAVQGPDGNLYLATDADPGQILKVVPSG